MSHRVRSPIHRGAWIGLVVSLLACNAERDTARLESATPTRSDAGFTVSYDPATGSLVVHTDAGDALQTVDEGPGPNQAQIRVLGVELNAACGFENSFCVDVELVSHFATEQLTDARAVLTSLSSNSTVLNSDLPGLGGWLYGDVAASESCTPPSPAVRRWTFDTTAGGRVTFSGEIRALVESPPPASCDGGNCDTCSGCSCSQSCSGAASCDASCTDGASCVIEVSNANNGTLTCVDSICDLKCSSINNCDQICSGTASCVTECTNLNNCLTECTNDSTCISSCAGANNCNFACDGNSSCVIDCAQFNSCRTTCEDQASCVQVCERANNCDLDCGGSAQCLLQCPPKDKKCSLNCDGTLTDCGNDLFACNRPCP